MRLCERLQIDVPVIQAPMAGVQDWQLAAAVGRAGGLGSIPCAMLDAAGVVEEVERFRGACDAPCNLNFFCHDMPTADETTLRAWERRLEPFYRELEVEAPPTLSGLRQPFDTRIADALQPLAPSVMSFHFGLPPTRLVDRIKSWGATILASATTEQEGIWLQQHGADVVIAQGLEAGGHRSMFLTDDPATQLTTRKLVQRLARTLSVPIVAAGGLADAADIREAMHWGCAGVQLGTSFLLCDEAGTSPLHRAALSEADRPTALTNVFSGRLARGIGNRVMRELGFVSEDAPPFPYAAVALSVLRARAEARGQDDFSPLWAGTNRRGCRSVPAEDLLASLWPPKLPE